MTVYRIAKWQYLEDLSGQGARRYGGRWNQEGTDMLYTSSHLSLAVLELLANQVRRLVDDTYGFICLEIPETLSLRAIYNDDLEKHWRISQYSDLTVRIGTKWIETQESLALVVPSAVLCQENNVLINPNHPSFSQIKINETGPLDLDGRISDI